MNKIYYFIYLNLLIVFVNCINCNQEPIYKLINGECNSNNNEISSPILYIEDYYNYDNISTSPAPISSIVENGYYQLYLNYDQEYSITFVNSNCNDQSNNIINIKTNVGPRLNITQPKCLNSYASIDFISGSGSSGSGSSGSSGDSIDSSSSGDSLNREFYIDNQLVKLPYDLKFNNLNSINFYSKLNNLIECRSDILLYQDSNNEILEPEIRIIAAQCNKDGKIIVVNNQNYTSIQLLDLGNKQFIESSGSSGIFENLKQGQYSIILESINCGKQSLDVRVENSPPEYEMILVDDTCPNKPKYLISIKDSKYQFQLIKNTNILGNPFEYDHQSIYISIENCGLFTIPPVTLSSYPPIHYTTSSNLDNSFCQDNSYNITFYSTLSNFTVQYYNIDHSYDSGLVQLNENNSFIADVNYKYEIKSIDCYSNSIIINPPTPVPLYSSISNKTNYCNELVDISIYNWEDFTTMYIIPSYSSNDDDDGNDSKIKSINGVFKQVPNQEYQLYYIYKNCTSTERYITIGNNNQDSNIYYNIKVLNDPTCDNLFGGLLEISIFDNFTNNEIIKVNQSLSYFNDYSNQFIISLLPKFSCNANINFNYTSIDPDIKIKILKLPICKYSNATISINSSSNIGSIYINGNKQAMDNNNNYQVPVGNNSITIDFISNGIICNSITTYYYVDSQYPNFKLEYDTTPINDCNISSGGFSIKNYQQYSKLLINGNHSILDSGNSDNNYSSGLVNVEFSIKLGTGEDQICSGIENIYIPTSVQIDNQPYKIIQEPLCDTDNSGVISFNNTIKLKKDNDKSYNIDKVEGNSLNSVSVGIHNYLIYSGTCSWNISIQINSIDVEIKPILESYFIQECAGNYRYKLNYNNQLAERTSIVKSSIGNGQIRNYIIGDTNSNGESISVDIKYGNNLSCQKSLTIQPQQPSINNIKYNIISVNGDKSCISGYSTIDIQVENYNQFNNLLYGNIASNSNGIFKNVRPGDYITASHFKYNCNITTKVVYEYNEIISINKSIIDETCYENFNGQVEILKDNNTASDVEMYNYFIQNLDTLSFYPIKSNQDIRSFKYLGGSNRLSVIRILKNNQTCMAYDNFEMKCTNSINNKNQNIGLIVGLPIGIICLVSLFGIIYLYKKKNSSTKGTDFIKLKAFKDQDNLDEDDI